MNTEFEEQNAILQKHTESMNCAKEKLEQELAQEERQTLALQQQLQSVRQALTTSFASLPIPGELGAAPGSGLAVPGHGGHVEGAEASRGCSRDVSGVVITARLVGGGLQSTWGSPESPDVPGSSSVAGQDKLGAVLVPRCSHSFLWGGVRKRNNPFVPGFVSVGAQCCRTHGLVQDLIPSTMHGAGWGLTGLLPCRHRGDADAEHSGLLHGQAAQRHREQPPAAREAGGSHQGDPVPDSQVSGAGLAGTRRGCRGGLGAVSTRFWGGEVKPSHLASFSTPCSEHL